MASKHFSFKTFTSFILAWSFLALIISGAVLYVAPAGRIANWTRWQLIILTKEQWQAVHTLTAIVFLVGGLFHLLKFNWKVFIAYLRRKTDAGLAFRNEIIASLVLFLVILAGTIAEQPPFATVMATGESIRQFWDNPAQTPPIAHMEQMTLQELARNMQVEPEELLQSLLKLGYAATGQDELLQQLAERYQKSPVQIYDALKANQPPDAANRQATASGGASGGGQGFKTLAELAGEYGLTTEDALRSLAAKGIEAGADEKMREIADRSGKKPYELIEILKGEKIQ
jgi:hypothetical protein